MEKLLKQIIKENVVLWQLKINFKLYSFLQPSSWGRGWAVLAFQYQLYFISICLLMKQCSRVGIPLEQKSLKLYIYDSRFSTSTNDFKTLSLNETTHFLEYIDLSSWKQRLSYILIYWFLPILDRCWWYFRAAITRLDFSDLKETLLEKAE